MLVYLSKKIAIPHNIKLNCISWNRDQGWIACGGDEGLLKVLKLEIPTGPDAKLQGVAASSNLSMNQTLEGHKSGVMCVTWNPIFRKLTTSDENGLIIVWMLHRGAWQEEMINNRNKSVVRDMKWTSDGRKIAIVYEDGAVIVGSVDGNRLWGKELNMPLRFVEWSPDSKLILFITYDAEIWIYDADGGKIRSLHIIGQDQSSLGGEVSITSIHWFCPPGGGSNSSKHSSTGEGVSYSLCIAFDNGKIQLMRGDDDATAEILDTDLASISYCRWSTKGNILAVVGAVRNPNAINSDRKLVSTSGSAKGGAANIVKFFDGTGRFLRSIRIPGDNITAISWEGMDLRLSLAVDTCIYFANIRHNYQWTYFLNTVVYSYPRHERKETAVVFWDLVSMEPHTKYVSNLKLLAAGGDLCALVVCEKDDAKGFRTAVPPTTKPSISSQSKDDETVNPPAVSSMGNKDIYSIQLRNSIGAVVDSKVIPFAPKHISMSPFHVTLTNDRTVYTWQFQSPVNKTGLGGGALQANILSSTQNNETDETVKSSTSTAPRNTPSKVRMFDIANITFSTAQSPETFLISSETISDPITCTTLSDRFLVIGRKSGSMTRFNLPHLVPENTYTIRSEPFCMELNCRSTKLSVIDSNGLFQLLDLEARVGNEVGEDDKDMMSSPTPNRSSSGTGVGVYFGKKLNIDRKDVWDMRWSEDDADMIVIMEKTKMVVINGDLPEEPVVCSAYLARFKDLEIRVVAMDELMMKPEQIDKECVVDFESKTLREAREKIATDGLQAGYSYADRNSHPRLWKLVGNAALEELDLVIAEKSYVRCGDYYGVQLVKQLSVMPDKMKARAEVSVHLGRFEEAETILREIDRKDLAIQLRKRLGDYTRVVQMLQTGGGNDALLRESWDKIGDYYADRFKWKKAAQYYLQSKNLEKLSECYYRLDQFDELRRLRVDLPDESPLLEVLGHQFQSVGMVEEAVDCYLHSALPPKDAVDCCVVLNKWGFALELAEKYDYPQVEGLLTKYALTLLSSEKRLEAVELFRVANKPTDAAILIADIAAREADKNVNPNLAKRLHVLSALEIEMHRKRALDQATQLATSGANGPQGGGSIAQTTAATLETLMMTALDGGGVGHNTLGGTLAATINATLGGGGGGGSNSMVRKAFGNAWRGAAAYHYYMLALRQFYAGSLDAAMKTAIKLCEYDDILNPGNTYALLCLASLRNKFYGICSKAFVKLETLPGLSESDRDAIQTLAVQIFLQNPPSDPATLPDPYIKCLELGRSFKACVISGRAIQDSPYHMCKTCRHLMLEHELLLPTFSSSSSSGTVHHGSGVEFSHASNQKKTKYQHCPLCHSPLILSATSSSSSGIHSKLDKN